MQRDGQMLIETETDDVAATLAIIARHGAASATLAVQLAGDRAVVEQLCPGHVTAAAALAVAAELAAADHCRAVAVKTLRRRRDGQSGAAHVKEELAAWAAPVAGHHWRAAA